METLIEERLGVAYNGESKAAIRAAHEANWEILERNSGGGGEACQ